MAKADRKTLRQTFDQAAELYDQVRTGYPDQLFDDLFLLGGLPSDPVVLEIGCGTGQATRSLAQRGCRVTCVELGANLAEVARRNFEKNPKVKVIHSGFEAWDPQGALFDMVFAATSWHWLDPDVRYVKAARLLKPGGKLAILISESAYPTDFDPFFTELRKFYKSIGEAAGKWPPPKPEEVLDKSLEIKKSRLFGDVQIRRYLWNVDYTAQQYVDFLSTHSSLQAMDPAKREKIYAETRRLVEGRPSGKITKHYYAILHVASVAAKN